MNGGGKGKREEQRKGDGWERRQEQEGKERQVESLLLSRYFLGNVYMASLNNL